MLVASVVDSDSLAGELHFFSRDGVVMVST
jgi:hypothetical protein